MFVIGSLDSLDRIQRLQRLQANQFRLQTLQLQLIVAPLFLFLPVLHNLLRLPLRELPPFPGPLRPCLL